MTTTEAIPEHVEEEKTERVTVECEACGAVLCPSKMGVACERAKAVA